MFVLVNVIYTVSLASRVVFKTLANSQLCISYATKAQHWLRHMHRVGVRLEEDDTETLQCVALNLVNELQSHTCAAARTHSNIHMPTSG